MVGPKLSLEALNLLTSYLPEAMLQAGWAEMQLVDSQEEFRLTSKGESMVRHARRQKEMDDWDNNYECHEARTQV